MAGTFAMGVAVLALGALGGGLASSQQVHVALLERPRPPGVVAPIAARGIDPATLRVAARGEGVVWYAARRAGDPASICLLSLGDGGRVVLHRCAPIARGLVGGARRVGARLHVAGIVPDGIATVTIGPRTAVVRGNAFTVTTTRLPDVVILQGPAAPRIPRRRDVAVATRVGDPPAVAVSFVPDPAADAPLGLPGTLRAAASAMPFTVLAPDPPPRGAPTVRWADGVPGIGPRVELGYLRTSGPGISVVEHAAAPGAPDAPPALARDTPEGAIVRTVQAGTVAEVRGAGDRVGELLAVAASLRPVAP